MKNTKETGQIESEFSTANIVYNYVVETKYSIDSIENNLPPLPLDIYFQITSWLCDVSKEKNCEGVCSLTLVDNEWQVIVWHQTAPSSLHVQFDESSEENQALLTDVLRDALRHVHCTIHSHHTAPASQSGDDASDEKNKPGWHITIGNCQSAAMSLHTRFNVFRNAVFSDKQDTLGQKISDAHQEFIVTDIDTVLEDVHADGVDALFIKDLKDIAKTPIKQEYPAEWLDRVVVTKPTVSRMWNSNSYYHQQQIKKNTSHSTSYDDAWDYYESYITSDSSKDTTKPASAIFSEIEYPNSAIWQYCQALWQLWSQDDAYSKKVEDISCLQYKDMFNMCQEATVLASEKLGKVIKMPARLVTDKFPSSETTVELIDSLYDEKYENNWWPLNEQDNTAFILNELHSLLKKQTIKHDSQRSSHAPR